MDPVLPQGETDNVMFSEGTGTRKHILYQFPRTRY